MMSAQMTFSHARQVIRAHVQIRFASSAQLRQSPVVRRLARSKDLGQQIYVFNHIQTNQVVYSLTKALRNNAALRQIPFNGKKTVPAALRKDVWSPLATISFAPEAKSIGLSAFQKLREYKRLHELQWDDSLMTNEKGLFIPKKKRGRQISNQKANAIADIAAVLGKIGTAEGEEIGIKGTTSSTQELVQAGAKVEVKWTNLLDAEFAETWSDNVVHDKLEWENNNRDPEHWERRRRAQEAEERNEKLGLSGEPLTEEEQVEGYQKQKAYWANLDKKREQWYLAQGKSLDEMPQRKIVDPALEEYIRVGVAGKISSQEKDAERAQKQREYWANLDKKREEWYLAQGKSLDEIPPRKIVESISRVQSSSLNEISPRKDVELTPSPTTLRTLRMLREKKSQQEKEIARKITSEETLQQKAAKQQAHWAETDRQRKEYYIAQGKSLDEIPPTKNTASTNLSSTATLQRLQQKRIAQRTRIDQEIARVRKVAENEIKMREFWAEQDRRRAEFYLAQGKSLKEIKPQAIHHIRRMQMSLPFKSAKLVRTRDEVLSGRANQAHEQKNKPKRAATTKSTKRITSQEEAERKRALQEGKEEKQKAYWAELARTRAEWHANQGKSLL